MITTSLVLVLICLDERRPREDREKIEEKMLWTGGRFGLLRPREDSMLSARCCGDGKMEGC